MNSEHYYRDELVAYLDGELSEADKQRVEAHLATCGECRAAIKELVNLQNDIAHTLDTALTPVHLSYSANERIREVLLSRLERRHIWWHAFWKQRGLVGQALAAIFVVFLSISMLRITAPTAPAPVHEVSVLGQERYAPGSQGALRVIVQSLGSIVPVALPVPDAEVIVKLSRTTDVMQTLFTGKTDDTGSLDVVFMVPEDVEGKAELIVETISSVGSERVIKPIEIMRTHKIYLGSDKPVYRPGQTIYLRALSLDAITNNPSAGDILEFAIYHVDNGLLYEHAVALSSYGVGHSAYDLPEDAPTGHYILRARIGDTTSERYIDVNTYPRPAFSVSLSTEETYLMPGDRLHGSLSAVYFFGKPVQGTVRVTVLTDHELILTDLTGVLDEDGHYLFTIDIPMDMDAGAVSVHAAVMDMAGQSEGIQKSLPLSERPILIKAIPESGRFVPGIENIIYLTTLYPDGFPAQTEITAVYQGARKRVKTDPYGIAIFRLIPHDSTTLEVTARDASGLESLEMIPITIDDAMQALLLRVQKAVYTVGETLKAEAFVAADNIDYVYLDVVHSAQTVAVLAAPVVDQGAVFALDLDTSLVGTLSLRAYVFRDGNVLMEDSRLVVVDPADQLDVSIRADKEIYRPGEIARLDFETTVESQTGLRIPTQSVLGIAAIDTSVLSLDRLPPGFARTFFLMNNDLINARDQVPGFDPPALLEGEQTMKLAQDIAAQAAWAKAELVDYAPLSSVQIEGKDTRALTASRVMHIMLWSLIVIPVIGCVITVQGLLPTGVLWHALRRLGWGLLAMAVLSPFILGGFVIGQLVPWLGAGLAIILSLVVIATVTGLAILSWQSRDSRVQFTIVLVVLYLAIAVCTLYLSSLYVEPAGGWIIWIAVFYLVFLASLYVMGQGFLLEKRRSIGWVLVLLVLLMIMLATSLSAVPILTSNLSRTISHPLLYSGPVGWMSGCGVMEAEPMATEEPAMEKEVEATSEPLPTPSPMPTVVPAPAETATAVTIPTEPYPFRQLFPETLYWAPEVETGTDGTLHVEVPLADTITTWRLSALASTQQGEIGAVTYDLRVFQDFFVEIVLPQDAIVGETSTITLTLYNYLDVPQHIAWELGDSKDYRIETRPSAFTIEANAVTITSFEITPTRSGVVIMEIQVVGETMRDAISFEMNVNSP